jgi:ribosome-associated protein
MDLEVSPGLVLPASELRWKFSRSSGPGGQHVNTSDSRVQLTWSVVESAALSDEQRALILTRFGRRAVAGAVTVTVSQQRSQLRNRETALDSLADLVRAALAPPAALRRATRPTRGSARRHLAAKQLHSATKQRRRRPTGDWKRRMDPHRSPGKGRAGSWLEAAVGATAHPRWLPSPRVCVVDAWKRPCQRMICRGSYWRGSRVLHSMSWNAGREFVVHPLLRSLGPVTQETYDESELAGQVRQAFRAARWSARRPSCHPVRFSRIPMGVFFRRRLWAGWLLNCPAGSRATGAGRRSAAGGSRHAVDPHRIVLHPAASLADSRSDGALS